MRWALLALCVVAFAVPRADAQEVTRNTTPVASVSGLAAVATSGSASDLSTGTLPVGRLTVPNTLNTGTAGLNPTGTASGTAVMMGLGSSATIAPNLTTSVLITIQGQVSNNTANDGSGIQVRYGTGTAPVNGAAATGTNCITATGTFGTVAAGFKVPFSVTCVATGLTVGTTYWIDAGLFQLTGGTATIGNVTVIAVAL